MIKGKVLKTLSAALAITIGLTIMPVTSFAKVIVSDDIYEHYKLSPESVRKSFEDDDWDLQTVKGSELNFLYGKGDFYNNGYDISGVTVYQIRTIYLSDSPGFAQIALNHEMGHFVDYSYYQYYGIQPSQTTDFYRIYNAEAAFSKLYENYELSDITEYFAQSYWSYVEDKESLQKFYPRTYEYMEMIIDDFDAAIANGFNRVHDYDTFMQSAANYKKTDSALVSVDFADTTKKLDVKAHMLLRNPVEVPYNW